MNWLVTPAGISRRGQSAMFVDVPAANVVRTGGRWTVATVSFIPVSERVTVRCRPGWGTGRRRQGDHHDRIHFPHPPFGSAATPTAARAGYGSGNRSP